jgi:hypothetical protein
MIIAILERAAVSRARRSIHGFRHGGIGTPSLSSEHNRKSMVGRNDEMLHCNRTVQQAVFDKIVGPKRFLEIEGGHFGLLWNPSPLFDEAAAHQAKFLQEILGG